MKGEYVTIVCPQEHPRPSVLRRVWKGLVGLAGWLLALTPGLLIIAYGAGGIRTGKLGGGLRWRSVSTGDDAVGWGWLLVGLGFWALGGFCHLKTGHAIAKVAGWALAIIASGIGVWVLLRRFWH